MASLGGLIYLAFVLAFGHGADDCRRYAAPLVRSLVSGSSATQRSPALVYEGDNREHQ
jgi:phosphate/sulfate permease